MTPDVLNRYVQEVLDRAPALSAEQKGVIATALSGQPDNTVADKCTSGTSHQEGAA